MTRERPDGLPSGLPTERPRQSRRAGLAGLEQPTLYLLGLLSTLKAIALVGLATALASGVVGVIGRDADWSFVIGVGAASALLRALVTWAHRVVASRALLGAKEHLRGLLADALVGGGAASEGSAVLATRGLDELDKYYTVFLPALVNAATVPLLVGARILLADWVSAIVIVLTVPLIPVFMALIGVHTRERVADATDALARLSDHLVELARGLPVLVGLGRAREQTAALGRISERYRRTTMQTLRTAFLSSLVLELIATISVAVVAVFIGVRLVSGEMTLEVGLLALLLAPECFAPFRDIGTAFHASADGREALARVRAIVDAPTLRAFARADGSGVHVDRLTVRYPGRSEPAVDGLSFAARRGSITVLDGRSGAGKSTVFGVLSGRIPDGAPGASDPTPSGIPVGAVTRVVTGVVTGVDPERIAWLPQHPVLLDGSVRAELEAYGGAGVRIDEILGTLGLAHLADSHTATVSPGELRRIAFARVLLRVDAGATLVLLDEPTAQLDDLSARTIVAEIAALRDVATVIVASHDPAVRLLADERVRLDDSARAVPAAAVAEPERRGQSRAAAAVAAADSDADTDRHTARSLVAFFRPQLGRVVGAIILGTGATLFALSLTALSGWLIVRASQQPSMMYLMVAIVGVRFFGVGRAVLRYFERLAGHGAVFAAVSGLRLRIWAGLASSGLRSRALLRGGTALDHLVGEVDEVRDLSIRVVLPSVTGALSVILAVVGLGIVYPPLFPILGALALLGLVVAPALALIADRSASRYEQAVRSRVLRRFAAMLAAADDLRVNGVDGGVRSELQRMDARASRAARRGARALGLGSAVVVLGCGLTAVLVLPLTAGAIASGALRPELLAVLVLTPLGLIDPLLDLVAAVQNYPRLARVFSRLARLPAEAPSPAVTVGTPVSEIELDGVSAIWPGTTEPVFEDVSIRVGVGQWLVVTGASGSGKSTILAVLIGQLPVSAGRYLVNGRSDNVLPIGRIGWCPQEGHLFNSSLRANLLIARARADAPTEGEMLDALALVGLGPLLRRLPEGLDTGIGSNGAALSGGERQRVAVARTLLTRADLVLIDEPTAHLDAEAAESLMRDLRVALRDRITVLVTHQAVGLRAEDRRVDLDRARSARAGEARAIPLTVIPGLAVSGAA